MSMLVRRLVQTSRFHSVLLHCMRDIGMHCISSLWRERWSRFVSLSLVDFGLWQRTLKAALVGFPNFYSETSSNSLQNLSKKLLISVKKMQWRIRVKRIRLCKLIGPLPGGWQSREGWRWEEGLEGWVCYIALLSLIGSAQATSE